MQLAIFAITIPRAPPGICTKKFAPTLGLLHPSFCPGAGIFWVAPEGRGFAIIDFCHFWNFHYNGKNWRQTTLWGLFLVLKFYMF